MTKDQIREQMRSLRRCNPDSQADSATICRIIESLPEFEKASFILSYDPIKGEVDVKGIDCRGKKVILTNIPWEEIPAGEIDFAIIPGVAFDKKGMRLGRGGGYYDRLLPLLHCPVAAVAYPFQIIDEIPTEEWDQPADMVITPDGVLK